MKILFYIIIFFLVVFAFYGFLILKEYLRYYVRSLRIKFNEKLDFSRSAPSDAEVQQ